MMHYCAYSFADLFKAANGRPATSKENQTFEKLSQPERNREVAKLAERANWQTESVKTSEGLFVAFWPSP